MKWLQSLRREPMEDSGNSSVVTDRTADQMAAATPATEPAVVPPASVEQTQSASASDDLTAGGQPQSSVAASTEKTPIGPDEEAPATSRPDATAIVELLGEMQAQFGAFRQELSAGQQALNDQFATRLRSDEAQARAVEKLHDELRQYKTNFVRQQLLPLLKEVIFCHDFVSAQIEKLSAAGEATSAVRPLEATQQMLIDLLFKYDVEPYRSEGETFDPKWQQCTHTVPIGRAEGDKSIAARGLTGFRAPEGVVRREQVSVCKFTPGAD